MTKRSGCLCGCGGTPSEHPSLYLPEHDAKHVSGLLALVADGSVSRTDAQGELAHSPKLTAKLETAVANASRLNRR